LPINAPPIAKGTNSLLVIAIAWSAISSDTSRYFFHIGEEEVNGNEGVNYQDAGYHRGGLEAMRKHVPESYCVVHLVCIIDAGPNNGSAKDDGWQPGVPALKTIACKAGDYIQHDNYQRNDESFCKRSSHFVFDPSFHVSWFCWLRLVY
jgi:hypothetical protein